MRQRLTLHFFIIIVILITASLACNFVTNFFEENPKSYNSPPTPAGFIPTLSCPAVTDRVLEVATEFYEEDTNDEKGEEPEELYLVTYSVSGNQISDPAYFEDISPDLIGYQEDEAGHQEIWDYFTTLIPSGERGSLAEYSIVTDGEGNLLAAVAQTFYDPALWGLEVDIRDSGDKLNLTYTLIHENAHLLTLGPDQVTPSEAVFDNPDDEDIYYDEVSACPNYFPGEGCSHSSSYINAFFNQFWADIYEEWQGVNLIEDDDAYYEVLDDFYYKYEDRFVTDYAATNPEEDIAEAFTFFVLSPRPSGETIAEEKVLFFYNYPELVQLHDEIITGICNLNQ